MCQYTNNVAKVSSLSIYSAYFPSRLHEECLAVSYSAQWQPQVTMPRTQITPSQKHPKHNLYTLLPMPSIVHYCNFLPSLYRKGSVNISSRCNVYRRILSVYPLLPIPAITVLYRQGDFSSNNSLLLLL